MTKMTTLIAAAALMAGLSTSLAAPADAKPRTPVATQWDGGNARASARIDSRIGELKDRIRLGERTHALSRREAARLTDRLNGIKSDKRSDERHGLSDREVVSLNASLDRLSTDIRVQSGDHNRR